MTLKQRSAHSFSFKLQTSLLFYVTTMGIGREWKNGPWPPPGFWKFTFFCYIFSK